MSVCTILGGFNPYLMYTWNRKQITEWFKTYDCGGGFTWWNGDRWEINTKGLGAGFYRVTFKKTT